MLTVKNKWREIAESGADTAILPIGSIEQHGDHLPLAVDHLLVEVFAKQLAEKLGNVYLLPTMKYGCSVEHMAFPGTIALRPWTLAAFIEDVAESLRQHGFKYLIVTSGHGGNYIIGPTLRTINYRQKDILCINANGPLPEEGEKVPEDIHAGHGETSRMLAYHPDLVGDYKAQPDTPGVVGQEFLNYIGFDLTTRSGVWGRPAGASPEQARASNDRSVEHSVRYVAWVKRRVAEAREKGSCAAPRKT